MVKAAHEVSGSESTRSGSMKNIALGLIAGLGLGVFVMTWQAVSGTATVLVSLF